MPATLFKESDTLYRVEARGLLSKSEFDRCAAEIATALAGGARPIRLLCLLDGFEGWAESGDWNDITFYVRHGDALERIAIVGDERWRSMSLMFANADLRKGEVQFFPTAALAEARAWVTAQSKPAGAR